jgi:outer membrane receptor protein involved in Fe transport
MNRPTPAVAAVDHTHGVDLDESARPRWRATSSVHWSRGRFGATVQWNYVGSYSTRAGAPAAADRPVDSWNTFDAQGSVALGERFQLVAGVRNFTDQEPPFFNRGTGGAYGFDPSAHDPRGASYYLRLRTTF